MHQPVGQSVSRTVNQSPCTVSLFYCLTVLLSHDLHSFDFRSVYSVTRSIIKPEDWVGQQKQALHGGIQHGIQEVLQSAQTKWLRDFLRISTIYSGEFLCNLLPLAVGSKNFAQNWI